MITGIDPGVGESALATYDKRSGLHRAWFDSAAHRFAVKQVLPLVICEMPQAYERSDGKDRQDVVDLAATVGEWRLLQALTQQHAGKNFYTVFPREWKGQQKKWTNHHHIWFNLLTPQDRQVFSTCAGIPIAKIEKYITEACHAYALGKTPKYGWKAHNLLDAVGISIHGETKYG